MSREMSPDLRLALGAAIRAHDTAAARSLLETHAELRPLLNQPAAELPFGALPLMPVVQRWHREMVDLLLEFGADINARSDWWAGGFGVLDTCAPEVAPELIARGAIVDAHAAARLGMMDRLQQLVARDPALVHARGGDGQTPLHFAASVDVAEYLLAHGADIDAHDIDHESTPAQWMLRDRQNVARYLVERGTRTDLLMTVALGDLARTQQHLDADPDCVRISVTERWFPKQKPRAGGSIYIWTLGINRTAHAVARQFGHADVLALLLERSPAVVKLAVACETGDEKGAKSILATRPALLESLTDQELGRLPDAVEDEHHEASRLMLAVGWPVDAPGQHGGTALHWAAWHGDRAMVREILRHRPALEIRDRDYDGTPLGWAIHASVHGWHPGRGDYAGVVADLMAAGAVAPAPSDELEASEAVRAALAHRAHGG